MVAKTVQLVMSTGKRVRLLKLKEMEVLSHVLLLVITRVTFRPTEPGQEQFAQ